jgi:hypothetical protein
VIAQLALFDSVCKAWDVTSDYVNGGILFFAICALYLQSINIAKGCHWYMMHRENP